MNAASAGGRLSAQDLTFLEHQAPTSPFNVGGYVRLIGGGLTLDRTRELVGERIGALRRMRQCPVRDAGGYRWVDDEDFAIEHHIDRAPVGADGEALLRYLADEHAAPLEPGRPPWHISLLPATPTAGPALLFRANHALVDGMSAMWLLRVLFDGVVRIGERPAAPVASAGDAGTQSSRGRRGRWSAEQYQQAIELLDGWISILGQTMHGEPRFVSSAPIRTGVALTRLDHGALRAVRLRHSVRFDVVCLSIVGAALGRLLAARGESVHEPVRVLVPVAVGGATREGLGNRASFLIVSLPVSVMPAIERLRFVAGAVDEALRAGQHRAVATSMRIPDALPPELADAVWEQTNTGHPVDLTVSCIAGPRRAATFGGLAHDVTHPLLPITPHVRVAVGFADVAGALGVGVVVDRTVVPEIDFLSAELRSATTDLIASS